MGRRKKIEKELLAETEATPIARGLRVKRVRNMANLSRQQMCENSDININSLKGWEIGRYGGLTSYGAEKILHRIASEGVHCTKDWLMYGIGSGPTIQSSFTKTKIENFSPLIDLTSTIVNDEGEKIAAEIMLFKKHYTDTIDFIVEDDGMLPHFNIGEYVAGINLHAEQMNKAIDLECIIQLEDGKILLRKLRRGSEPHTYTLICSNIHTQLEEPILYNVKINSVAPIIYHRRKNLIS